MQNKSISDKVLIAGMVISMCLWGLSWSSSKYLMHYCTPVNLAAYRYMVVVATFIPMLFIFRTGMKIKRSGIPSVVISGVLLAMYSLLCFQGLRKGAAGAGGVLVTTLNPIMAYVIGAFLHKRIPSGNEIIGLLLGVIAGCFLLRVWDHIDTVLESGNLYFLVAALTWAAMSKFTSRAKLYGTSLGFSLWQYLVTLLCMLPLINVAEFHSVVYNRDPLFWMNIFFGAAIVTTLATTMYFYTTTRLGAEKASSFIFLVPFAAAFSAWLFLGERILPNTIIGGVLGMTAVYMINKRKPEIIVEPD